ncbi:Bardet-Biedl syndrome 4 protein-like [Ornithodoros turicata]|uniref:Bardet-Biedl syndrome 4 protein-like n=1 Tax=Ornithodoros turicata TaxID=34597 RepID=UPI0031396F4F
MAGFAKEPLPSSSGGFNSKTALEHAKSKKSADDAATRPKPKKASELPSVERKNWLVHMHLVRKEFNTCKLLIREQLNETHGMCEYALYVQGLILRREGQIKASMEMFQSCALLNGDTTNLEQVARSLFLSGRHQAAIDIYEECIQLGAKDWDMYHTLGLCYMRLQNLEKAKECFTESLHLSPHDETAVVLGQLLETMDDVKGAVATYRKALDYHPESAELNTRLGLLYIQCGVYQKAFERLGAALACDATYTAAVLAAGSIMQTYGDYDVALSKYRVVAPTAPENPALWNNIGMCFFGKKKYVAAISCLKRANYLSPLDWQALHNLGFVHLTMQQYASAFHFLSAAVNLNPQSGQLYMLLALALKNLQDPENAKTAYQKALRLDNDPVVCLNFAILLFNSGDHKKASELLNDFEVRCSAAQRSPAIEMDAGVVQMAGNLASCLRASHKDEVSGQSSSPQGEADTQPQASPEES